LFLKLRFLFDELFLLLAAAKESFAQRRALFSFGLQSYA